jgi:cytochrome oxidase Cu insertion factor (SCO1/SenC/PrrC family)
MMRWLLGAALIALAVSPAAAQPAASPVDPALWHAAGISVAVPPMQAPPFSLASLSGEPVDLRALRGRLVMVYFWATW